MIIKASPSYTVSIYCTGDKARLYAAIQETVDKMGLCVSIFPCDYLFTGGMESGYEVRLINYPRFPVSDTEMVYKANKVCETIFTVNPKGSLTMVLPHVSYFMSNREGDKE